MEVNLRREGANYHPQLSECERMPAPRRHVVQSRRCVAGRALIGWLSLRLDAACHPLLHDQDHLAPWAAEITGATAGIQAESV